VPDQHRTKTIFGVYVDCSHAVFTGIKTVLTNLTNKKTDMRISPLAISHDRLVQLKPIKENHNQFMNDHQTRYFIYEIDDNRWQDVNPEGETEYDLESIKQEPARLPVGILTVDTESNSFSFEGDLTISKEDQELLFQSLK
jgi:hypothetical protein